MYLCTQGFISTALWNSRGLFDTRLNLDSILLRKMSSIADTARGHDCDIVTKKKQLRKQVRSKMRELSKQDIKGQSLQVWKRLFDLPVYQEAKSIGLFLSMPSGEIDTDPAIRHAVEAGKQIYVPQVGKNFEQADMELLKVEQTAANPEELFHHSWPRNKWEIPEPPPEMPIVLAKEGDIDVLVVPGLAFDRKGERLGQGKGYYDRFIQHMISTDKKIPRLIAVGLTCQLVDEIPVESYDKRMDLVLIPGETIEPKN